MRKRILIVENDEDIGTLLLSALRDESRDVLLGRDLETAKAMTGIVDLDVIVLDIALPRGLEGLRFLDWYYAEPNRRGKVLVLSAVGKDILESISGDSRVAVVMNKPFAIEQLIATVERLERDQ